MSVPMKTWIDLHRWSRGRHGGNAFRKFSRISTDQRGTAAVEFAFVTPVLVLMMVGIIQFGAIFFVQSHMVSVARNSARYVAVREMNATQAQTSAASDLINWQGTFTVNVTEAGGDVSVDISIPLEKAALFDITGLFAGKTLQASVIMRKET